MKVEDEEHEWRLGKSTTASGTTSTARGTMIVIVVCRGLVLGCSVGAGEDGCPYQSHAYQNGPQHQNSTTTTAHQALHPAMVIVPHHDLKYVCLFSVSLSMWGCLMAAKFICKFWAFKGLKSQCEW